MDTETKGFENLATSERVHVGCVFFHGTRSGKTKGSILQGCYKLQETMSTYQFECLVSGETRGIRPTSMWIVDSTGLLMRRPKLKDADWWHSLLNCLNHSHFLLVSLQYIAGLHDCEPVPGRVQQTFLRSSCTRLLITQNASWPHLTSFQRKKAGIVVSSKISLWIYASRLRVDNMGRARMLPFNSLDSSFRYLAFLRIAREAGKSFLESCDQTLTTRRSCFCLIIFRLHRQMS